MSKELDVKDTMALIAGIKIPPAPTVLKRLHAELQKDEPEIARISGIIAEDIGLSALVLKTVNSPFFALKSHVKSIQHATSLLGLANTINIVAGLALMQSLGGEESDQKHWDESLFIARVAAAIAARFPGVNADEAYMLGLFHDAGKILLNQAFTGYDSFWTGLPLEGVEDLVQREDERFKTNHATVGYFLARTWGLDTDVCSVIRDHHDTARRIWENPPQDPAERQKLLLCILKMAEQIEYLHRSLPDNPEWQQIGMEVLGYVGLSEPDFEELSDQMLELVKAA